MCLTLLGGGGGLGRVRQCLTFGQICFSRRPLSPVVQLSSTHCTSSTTILLLPSPVLLLPPRLLLVNCSSRPLLSFNEILETPPLATQHLLDWGHQKTFLVQHSLTCVTRPWGTALQFSLSAQNDQLSPFIKELGHLDHSQLAVFSRPQCQSLFSQARKY